jgi:hypothetical protein
MQATIKFPGRRYLSETAATDTPVPNSTSIDAMAPTESKKDTATTRGWQFRHDPPLAMHSLQYNPKCQAQVEAMYQAIQCPVALVLARDGWPFDAKPHARMLEPSRPSI